MMNNNNKNNNHHLLIAIYNQYLKILRIINTDDNAAAIIKLTLSINNAA